MFKVAVSAMAGLALLVGATATPALADHDGGYYGPGYQDPDAPYSPNAQGYGPNYGPGYAQPYNYDPRYGGSYPYRYRGCDRGDRAAGTIIGGALGGIIANNISRGRGRGAATVAGIIFGGIAGNAIARANCRDRYADAYYYNRAYADAFDSPYYGRSYSWRNPYNGNYGYVTPMASYNDGYRYGYRGGVCKQFSQTIYIDGRRTQAYGTACRQGDGSWRIVNY